MKGRKLLFLFIALLVLVISTVPQVQAAGHKKKTKTVGAPVSAADGLKVEGLTLMADGRPVYLTGVEAPGLYRMTAVQLDAFFAQVKATGARVVKTNAFSLGKVPSPIQTGPGQWDESSLKHLDQMAASAGKAGLKLILDLCADGGPEGGKDSYAAWAGSPNSGVFYLDFQCRAWYQQYVQMLLTRVNTVTGVAYGKSKDIWAFNLLDSPAYAGGDPAVADQWASMMASFVKARTETQVVLSLDSNASGLSPVEMAGQPGIDFILEEMTANVPSPLSWAQTIGKPVACVAGNAQAPAGGLGAGFLVSIDPAQTNDWVAMKNSFAAQSLTGTPSGGKFFTSVSATPKGDAVVNWNATEMISITLSSPAQVTVRYGEKGLLNEETELTPNLSSSHQVVLTGLSTGKRYGYQIKARTASGTRYSSTLFFDIPPLKRLVAPPSPWTKNFITVKGTSFYDGEKPFRFVGTNNYYLHYMPDSIEYIFTEAEKMGFTVMRTWAFGEAEKLVPYDWEKLRYFQLSPGQYVESNLKLLDKVVASAGKHHIRLVLGLSNNWNDFGGAPQWVKWYGSTNKNDFFDNPAIEKGYQDYMATIVNRVNTLTGVAYKDDPTIMAWDLMNEPRDEKDTAGNVLVAWIDQMAGFLKKQGVRQLVTTGAEGLRANNGIHYSGTDFIKDHQSTSIDYAVFHVYPTMNSSGWNMGTIDAILNAYVKDAHEILKKPVVMEEFGIEKGKVGEAQSQYIYGMMRAFYGAGGDGTSYWMLEEPNYSGDANCFSPDDVEICNLFVLEAAKLAGGR